MNAAMKTRDATCAGQSEAACVITAPPMLDPTRIAGSGLAASTLHTRSEQLASVTSRDRRSVVTPAGKVESFDGMTRGL